ncbi:MAG: CDP-alcohol phosphatidyltransferase family protein, partial [Pirellulales bacterium]
MNPLRRSPAPSSKANQRSLINVPNTLCAIRLVGACAMVPIALANQPQWFLALFLVTALTDWIDGKLAIWLNQRTEIGARLDSIADAAMYGALLFGLGWLKGDVIWPEWPWIAAALLSYAATMATGAIKFRQWPSYHAYSAKLAWLATVLAAVALLAEWADPAAWPLRVAMAVVTAANIESLLITLISTEYRVDVPS